MRSQDVAYNFASLSRYTDNRYYSTNDDIQRRKYFDENLPRLIGQRPHFPREENTLTDIDAKEKVEIHSYLSAGNVIWCLLFGWWLALFYFVFGCVLLITGIFYRQGLFCLRLSLFLLYPFGKYYYVEGVKSPKKYDLVAWTILSPVYAFLMSVAGFLSWFVVYYIPMTKLLIDLIKLPFVADSMNVRFAKLVNNNPSFDHRPLQIVIYSGSWFYFKFTIFSIEVVYINLIPFVLLAMIIEYAPVHNTFLGDPIFGSFVALTGAIPCAYLIGICVEDLSVRLGVITGSLLNSFFIAMVELILYYFSLRTGLLDTVRAAVTGSFLMNLLIIPGVAMLAVGIKHKDTILNKRAQSISGTFLLLAILSVLFPSLLYNIHSSYSQTCKECKMVELTDSRSGFRLITDSGTYSLNCTFCSDSNLDVIEEDPVYTHYARPLMYTMSVLMPLIFILAMIFSIKTHAHLYQFAHTDHEGHMGKAFAIILLMLSTIAFSLMAHVMTEKIPEALEKIGFSQRFVGLIFYTIIPNCAEYINVIRFAINGNIGLSMEIGNQGAILTALIEMPAVMLLSIVMNRLKLASSTFTLIFPMADSLCVIIAVFLRNSILIEKSINYVTGLSFLIVFILISVVYYFEAF